MSHRRAGPFSGGNSRWIARWIALFAILLVTAMPTVARLMTPVADMSGLCSAAGQTGESRDGVAHQMQDACAWCSVAAHLAPPPPLSATAASPVAYQPMPPAFLQAPRRAGVWSSRQSRAPPSRA